MRILLLGKTGQLGWELQRTIAPLGEIYALGPEELNLTDLDDLARRINEDTSASNLECLSLHCCGPR